MDFIWQVVWKFLVLVANIIEFIISTVLSLISTIVALFNQFIGGLLFFLPDTIVSFITLVLFVVIGFRIYGLIRGDT